MCPVDQARLKADLSQGRPVLPLRLTCPDCGRQYVLGDGGLTEAPAGDGGS